MVDLGESARHHRCKQLEAELREQVRLRDEILIEIGVIVDGRFGPSSAVSLVRGTLKKVPRG